MVDKARAARLADRIKQIVARALEKRVKDPRLGFVTITDARVTGDLQHATLFYTVFGSEEERAGTAAALESAKGMLRSTVGAELGLKFTPTLAFVLDATPETAKSIEDLLARVHASDADLAARAAAGHYAGEADPYKKPRAESDDEE